MIATEEIVKALRCTASPWDGKDETETCKDCPYLTKEEPTAEFVFAANKTDGMIWGCDVDKIALDAASRLDELTKKLTRAGCDLLGVAQGAGPCSTCIYRNTGDTDGRCEGCDGENYEWRGES